MVLKKPSREVYRPGELCAIFQFPGNLENLEKILTTNSRARNVIVKGQKVNIYDFVQKQVLFIPYFYISRYS